MSMKNFKVTIAFDGSNYGGWQIQKNSYTIQQAVQDSLKKILKTRHKVTGCGRTDAGVHANGYVFNFKTESDIPEHGLFRALHITLPEDIAVLEVKEVGLDFSAQFSAVAKQYIYQFSNTVSRNPFLNRFALHYEYPMDDKLMDKAAKHFLGHHDFSAFCASGAQNVTSDRTIFRSDVIREGDVVRYYVAGNGFLYNMVRIMTGTLLYVSAGKLDADSIPDIIASGDRERAGKTLPPHGLYLDQVYYDNTHEKGVGSNGGE